MRLSAEQRDELLIQLSTAVLGVKDSEDKGMAGDIKELAKQQKITNGQVGKNTTFRKIGTWIGSALCLAIIGLCIKILTTGSAV